MCARHYLRQYATLLACAYPKLSSHSAYCQRRSWITQQSVHRLASSKRSKQPRRTNANKRQKAKPRSKYLDHSLDRWTLSLLDSHLRSRTWVSTRNQAADSYGDACVTTGHGSADTVMLDAYGDGSTGLCVANASRDSYVSTGHR
eukprot:839701-Rhodomonas_salina.1